MLETNRKNIKYFTGDGLIAVNRHAIKMKKNRSIRPNVLLGIVKHYPDSYKYPIVMDFIHNDKEMRCEVIICLDENREAVKVWVDMDMKIYNKYVEECSDVYKNWK